MSLTEKEPDCLAKIKSPAGDCITLKAYTEYVCEQLRDGLRLDEIRALLAWYHCPVEELVDKIVEHRMVGQPTKRKGTLMDTALQSVLERVGNLEHYTRDVLAGQVTQLSSRVANMEAAAVYLGAKIAALESVLAASLHHQHETAQLLQTLADRMEELVDKIVEHRMVGQPTKRKGR